MSIYSNDNNQKNREINHSRITAKVQKREENYTVRENNGLYSIVQ